MADGEVGMRWWDLRQLSSSSPTRRTNAARALGQSGDLDVVDALLPHCEDTDPEVQAAARAAVERIRERAMRQLMPLLTESERREATTEALRRIDGKWRRSNAAREAAAACIQALETGDRQARCNAAAGLGALHARAGIDALVRALNSEDGCVSSSAVRALGEIRDTRAIEPLLRYVLAARWKPDRESAIGALAQIDGRWTRSAPARSTIAKLGTMMVDPDEDRREVARSLLRTIDPQWPASDDARVAVPELIHALSDPSRLRGEAAELLGQIGDRRAFESLVESLADDDPFLVNHAARALGALGDRRAVEPLLHLVRREREREETFRVAARSLEKLGDERAVGPLVEMFRSFEDWRRPEVMKTLDALSPDWRQDVPSDLVIDGLVSRLWSYDKDAIYSLGRIGRPAVERLLETLRHGTPAARGHAAQALALIDDARVLPGLAESYEQHAMDADGRDLADALTAAGGPAAAVFLKETQDPDRVSLALSSLRTILETDRARVSEDVLRALAVLNGLVETTWVKDDDGTWWVTGEEKVDTADLRQLAGQELERRTRR